ncbi:MAG: DUF58 domain-containing protein [Guyparkeria sp.]
MAQQSLSRLQIRPRRFALGLAVVAVAMLLAAINYGNNLIFLIAFMVIALMVNSAWQGWRALAAVDARVVPPPIRPAGTPGAFTIEFSTPRGALPPLWVSTGDEAVLPQPAGDDHARVSLALPGEPRGYLPLPEVTIETRYPLGLWRIDRRLTPTVGQWIHPAPQEGRQRSLPVFQDDGGASPATEGDPTRLRPYHPGDPIRHVVFRHYAKTGQLITRHPEGDAERPDPELVDYETFTGPRETRLSAMTERLMQLQRAQRPWVLHLPGEPPVDATATANRAGRYPTALQRLARFGRPQDARGFDHPPPGEMT